MKRARRQLIEKAGCGSWDRWMGANQSKLSYAGYLIIFRFTFVFSVSSVTCFHALMFRKLFVSNGLCCSTSFHPLSETRAHALSSKCTE